MKDTAVIFGAGKTGRGFAAHLAFLAGCRVVLVDKNKSLVDALRSSGQYQIEIFGAPHLNCTVELSGVFALNDEAWHKEIIHCRVVFTAVFGDNLYELAAQLAAALDKRYYANADKLLTVLTCENMTDAGTALKHYVSEQLDTSKANWIQQRIAFSECIIFKTCLDPEPGTDPLKVRAQNYFRLPCNGDVLLETPPVYGLEPLSNFKNQLKRKIYTYNCINAVIAYQGAKKQYDQLYDAANDPEIRLTAGMAAQETSSAQLMEFGFEEAEQDEWTKAAFEKFSDSNIPDPISRNAADPVRKLRRDDRLVGPALLAIKHGIDPQGLLSGIIACIEYRDASTGECVADTVNQHGVNYVLNKICQLNSEEELFTILQAKLKNLYPDVAK